MALTDKDLRAIEKMLDEKFKLSEKMEAYEALKRSGNLNEPFTREDLKVAFDALLSQIDASNYLRSEEFYSLPWPPS